MIPGFMFGIPILGLFSLNLGKKCFFYFFLMEIVVTVANLVHSVWAALEPCNPAVNSVDHLLPFRILMSCCSACTRPVIFILDLVLRAVAYAGLKMRGRSLLGVTIAHCNLILTGTQLSSFFFFFSKSCCIHCICSVLAKYVVLLLR